MVGLARRVNGILANRIPERRLFIQSRLATKYIRLTPLVQLGLGAASLATVSWMAIATSTMVLNLIDAGDHAAQSQLLHESYESRLAELLEERDQRAAEAYSAQNRFQIAMEQISRQQSMMLRSVEERLELEAGLDLMRGRLQTVLAQRDLARAENEALLTRIGTVSETLARDGSAGGDVTETLQAVTAVLSDVVRVRDDATAERARLEAQLADLELQLEINSRRQDELLNQLEQAVQMSFGPLEELFSSSGLDVDSLIASVRRNYSGTGGGPADAVSVSTRSFEDAGLNSRFDELMIDLDRMNLLRIAADKIPYAIPVKATHRFTSGFGTRRDPKNGGRRMHSGIDLAAPRGTHIHATADGVVKSARHENGYGKTVRIQHAFGFETVYAHQHTLRVREGQQVSRGEHIGDMGTTGRSTGVHLHYEVRLNGKPVNPMTYVEAAKNVF